MQSLSECQPISPGVQDGHFDHLSGPRGAGPSTLRVAVKGGEIQGVFADYARRSAVGNDSGDTRIQFRQNTSPGKFETRFKPESIV